MIDSHCHLDLVPLCTQLQSLLHDSARLGVTDIIVPGLEPPQWSSVTRLCRDHGQILRLHRAVGVHPWWVSADLPPVAELRQLLEAELETSVAIGECGLDGAINTPIAEQEVYFELHLQLAELYRFPLIIHAHKAHNRVLQMLKRHQLPAGGVIHGFAGSAELALQYWRMGFLIGVGGTITYPRALKTRHAVETLPLQAMLLETDAPDMPLCGEQGRPNSPVQIAKVADTLAVIRGERVLEVVAQTTANAVALFGLSGGVSDV